MTENSLVLGIPVIDDDHRLIEGMFAAAAGAPADQLATHLAELETELSAHFAREEALMKSIGFPGLHCHMAQHNGLENELRRGRHMASRRNHDALRRHLAVVMPQLVISHIATMDRMTAAFIKGEIGTGTFTPLRLPVENASA